MSSCFERRAWLVLTLGLVASATSRVARADDASAEALFRDGRALMANGDLAAACQRFEASQAMAPSAGALLNLAACHEKQGKTATAWAEFIAAENLAKSQGKDKQQAEAHRRAEELEARLEYLTIRVLGPEPGLEVTRDGAPLATSVYGLRVPVDPGVHRVDASAPGFAPWHGEVRVGAAPGDDVIEIPKLEPALRNATSQSAVPSRSPEPSPAPLLGTSAASSSVGVSAQRASPWPWVIGGVGGALLIGGGVAGLLALNSNSKAEDLCPAADQCDNPKVPAIVRRRDTEATLADIGVIGGVAGLGTAAVLLLLTPPAAKVGLQVAPFAGRERAGLTLGHQF